MRQLALNHEVTIATIVAAVAFVFSLVTFTILQREKRRIERRKYADDIRHAATKPTVALDRWRELAMRFFDEIQPLITDADGMLAKGSSVIETRDFLWRGLWEARSRSIQRLSDANLEGAYSDLYGYDPRIQTLYHAAVSRLKATVQAVFEIALVKTQEEILSFSDKNSYQVLAWPIAIYPMGIDRKIGEVSKFESAALGNRLRQSCAVLADYSERRMSRIVNPITVQLLQLIHLTDKKILNRNMQLPSEDEVFGPIDDDCMEELRSSLSSCPKQTDSTIMDRVSIRLGMPSSRIMPFGNEFLQCVVCECTSYHFNLYSPQREVLPLPGRKRWTPHQIPWSPDE